MLKPLFPRFATFVALTAIVALPGPSAAAADFDPRSSLELVYGKLETKGDTALWKPTAEVWQAVKNAPGWDSVEVSVLAAPNFRQDGAERAFLLVQLVPHPDDDFKCHPCAPGIGAATFTNTAEGWRLDSQSPYVTDIGSYGAAPEPELVKVGPERYGVAFPWFYMGQGQAHAGKTYLLETDGGVNEALVLQTHYDNSGSCGPEDEGFHPCEEWTSTLEFVPGKDPDYFDLKVTGNETAVYAYSDGTYQKKSTDSHCSDSEVAIFYCGLEGKNLSVCRLDDGRVSYRFGKLGEPEITIDSAAILSSRAYPGGGEARLHFTKGAYDYLVYDLIRYGGIVDEETGLRGIEDSAGVHVLKDRKRIATLSCTDAYDADGGKLLSNKLVAKQEEEFLDLD